MKPIEKQNQNKTYECNGQLVIALNSEIIIPDNAPVRLGSAQLEELDYSKWYCAYSPVGRKSAADAGYESLDNYLYLDGMVLL